MIKSAIYYLLVVTLLCSCKASTDDGKNELSEEEVSELFATVSATALKTDSIPVYKDPIGEPDSSALAHLVTDMLPGCVAPQSISALNSGTEFKVYKFDKDLAASAAAMGFTSSIGKKQMVFIQDYIRYKLINCGGRAVKIGIGLRCFIHVKSIRGKLATATLPGVAASVELGRAEASFELKALGFGIDGDVLAEGLQPSAGDYNVDNFGKLAVTFNNTLKTLKSTNGLIINPVILP